MRETHVNAKYKEIAADLTKQINHKQLEKGGQLPSEASMQLQYKASRVTVRKALKLLHERGLLRTIPGKGTFVSDIDTQDWTWMLSFSKQITEAGYRPTSNILDFKTMKPGKEVREMLKLDKGQEVYVIKRLRCIENFPTWITYSYLPVSIAPGLSPYYFSVAGVTQSLYRVLELNYHLEFGQGVIIGDRMVDNSEKYSDLGMAENNIHSELQEKKFVAYDKGENPLVYEIVVMRKNLESW